MNIAYVTTYDAQDLRQWSGTPYFMSQHFERAAVTVDYIGSLITQLPPAFRLARAWKRIVHGQKESARFNIAANKYYAHQVSQRLKNSSAQAIVAPQVNPIAYLDCQQPLVLWTDALYAGLLGFYPPSNNLSAISVQQGNEVTAECLSRCRLAIFSSEWAARSAIELYGTAQEKVKVVPYGANMECHHTQADIQEMLKLRSPKLVKLLFIGKQWDIKGGDIVFRIAQGLHAAGQAVELNFVGCYPPGNDSIPAYIKCHGFISKRGDGMALMSKLFRESHFIVAPSRADCCPMVLAEGNAFGLPGLTTYVGGITTAIKNNRNGMTFSREAPIEQYCDYIIHLMDDYSQYEALALSSFHEYSTRLNWQVAIQHVKSLIQELI